MAITRKFDIRAWAPVAVVVLAILLFQPLSSPAQGSFSCGQVAERWKLRDLYPPSVFLPSTEGKFDVVTYRFKNFAALDREVSCKIDSLSAQQLRLQYGLLRCSGTEVNGRTSLIAPYCIQEGGTKKELVPLRGAKQAHAGYMQKRGFRRLEEEEEYLPDYSRHINNASLLLHSCGGDLDNHEDWLAFFLSMRSVRIKEYVKENHGGRRRWNAGLRLPADVLIRNGGDCDSKALAFCALQPDKTRWVIFRSTHLPCSREGHAFLGRPEGGMEGYEKRLNESEILSKAFEVTGASFKDGFLYIGSLLRYEVVDITGPGWTGIGRIPEEKYGFYMVDPVFIPPPATAPRRATPRRSQP